jgi:hypothetical protein
MAGTTARSEERLTWGIPTRDPSPGDPPASDAEALRDMVESQTRRIDELTGVLVERYARIVELEKLLEESRHRGKRRATPFSKG